MELWKTKQNKKTTLESPGCKSSALTTALFFASKECYTSDIVCSEDIPKAKVLHWVLTFLSMGILIWLNESR